jgi:hypothetical protein
MNNLISGLNPNLASKIYHIFKQHNFDHINIKSNPPIRTTVEEKSSYRLGLMAMSNAILHNDLATETELKYMIDKLANLEESNTLICGYRSRLNNNIAGCAFMSYCGNVQHGQLLYQ